MFQAVETKSKLYQEGHPAVQSAVHPAVQPKAQPVNQAVVQVVVLAVVALKKEAQAALLIQEPLKVKVVGKHLLHQALNNHHQKVLKNQVTANHRKKLFKMRMEKKFGKKFL